VSGPDGPGAEVIPVFHDEDFVAAQVGAGGLAGPVQGTCDGEEAPWVWLPISRYASDLLEKADQWRRRRRVPLKRWPPWM
jgi:hypothetical protein